jgi:hypothetical protein
MSDILVTPETAKTDNDLIASIIAESDPTEDVAASEVEETEAEPESDSSDSDDDSEDETEEEADSDEPSTQSYDAKALAKAIESEDAQAFIAALGDKANTLLGAKGHKALRKQASEVKKLLKKDEDLRAALLTKFKDPANALKAAQAGDMDAFVDIVERWSDMPWADCIKAVNASFAGKPARLESKAKQQAEAQTQAETAKKAAEAKVREHVTTVISKDKNDAKLLAAYPKLSELVFVKLQSGFKNGVNTPEKALKAVKADLQAEAKTLGKLFTKTEKKPSKVTPPNEDYRSPEGRPMTDDELIAQILREDGHRGRKR